MTNGGDARGGTREEVRQVPRVRAARFRGEDESMGGGATTANGGNWCEHCVHDYWRQLFEEDP